jgi:hypothetical protein
MIIAAVDLMVMPLKTAMAGGCCRTIDIEIVR